MLCSRMCRDTDSWGGVGVIKRLGGGENTKERSGKMSKDLKRGSPESLAKERRAGGKRLAVLKGILHVCVCVCVSARTVTAACVTCPWLPLACFVAQSPHSSLTHSHTIAALWLHTHTHSLSLLHHSSAHLLLPHPTFKSASVCFVVDISSITQFIQHS